jgi:hypothetical protein
MPRPASVADESAEMFQIVHWFYDDGITKDEIGRRLKINP